MWQPTVLHALRLSGQRDPNRPCERSRRHLQLRNNNDEETNNKDKTASTVTTGRTPGKRDDTEVHAGIAVQVQRKEVTMSDSDTAARYFGRGSNSKAANDLMKSNPTEYARLKEVALADGRLARSEHLDPNIRDPWNPRQFSAEELQILGQIPESETNRYYRNPSAGGDDTLSRVAAERPDYYKLLRASAVLRGFVPASQAPAAPEPKPVNPFFTLSDELCVKAGLPRGYQCDQLGLERVVQVIADIADKKREAETLAAKTAEKLERDRKADESAAEFGRLLEINRQHAAKQGAQTL